MEMSSKSDTAKQFLLSYSTFDMLSVTVQLGSAHCTTMQGIKSGTYQDIFTRIAVMLSVLGKMRSHYGDCGMISPCCQIVIGV